jgi:aldehyde:ferredoxin oxidoreductase
LLDICLAIICAIVRYPLEYVTSREELDSMLDKYFDLRKWDKKLGVPLPETLRRLGLDFTIPVAEKALQEG